MPGKNEQGECKSTGWWYQDINKESRNGEDVLVKEYQDFRGEMNNCGNDRYWGAGEGPWEMGLRRGQLLYKLLFTATLGHLELVPKTTGIH